MAITEKDIHDFTYGDCYLLAEAIHHFDRDWELVYFKGDGAGHAFCIKRDDDSVAIDVKGVRPTQEILDEWGYEKRDIKYGFDYYRNGVYENSVFRANRIAKELLNR